MKRTTATLVLALGAAGAASASPITWGAAQANTTDAAADIADGGAVALALNGYFIVDTDPNVPPDVTLDGVLFTAENFLTQVFGGTPAQLAGNSTGDADYDHLLNNASIVNGGSPANNDHTYVIEGLTDGTDYLLQLWYVDERAAQAGRVMVYGDGEVTENTVEVAGQGDNFFGNNVVGTFTASGTTQDLHMTAKDLAFGRSHVSAILVREVGGGFDPADLDQDGDVDDADFGIAFAAFTGPNNGPSSNPAADLDGDGDVDDADFGIAFAAFTGPGGAAVPEPTSLALLGLGGLLAARRRRA